jgi:hypothetical protein
MTPPNRFKRACLLAALLLAGCSSERATPNDCRQILDRIVDVELAEQGFRDRALAARRRDDLRRVLAPELRACPGRKLPAGALTCLTNARNAEEISHRCLR